MGSSMCDSENLLNDLIVHSVTKRYGDDIPKDDTNCIKPLLFELFPNLTQITIQTVLSKVHSFSFLSLLRILKSVEFHASFEELIITGNWFKNVFCDELVDAFAAEHLRIEFVAPTTYGFEKIIISV